MKKLLSLVLATVMVLSLAACGSNANSVAKVIDVELTVEQYAFGVRKDSPELLGQVNAIIGNFLTDGTFETVCNNYFGDGEPQAVYSAVQGASDNQLLVATNAEFAPFEYKEGEAYYGIDMEIAKLLADELGKELVIVNMDFDAVCLSVSQGKADIAMAGLTVNETRQQSVNFTNSYYNAAQVVITLDNDTSFDNCTTADDVLAVLAAALKK